MDSQVAGLACVVDGFVVPAAEVAEEEEAD